MRAISYRAELVAIATEERVLLAPTVEALEATHPKLRFVAAMCLYSHDVDRGYVPGPYADQWAELYARCLLVPDDDFMHHRDEPDEKLARRFCVPVEQIAEKRRDVATTSGAGRLASP